MRHLCDVVKFVNLRSPFFLIPRVNRPQIIPNSTAGRILFHNEYFSSVLRRGTRRKHPAGSRADDQHFSFQRFLNRTGLNLRFLSQPIVG